MVIAVKTNPQKFVMEKSEFEKNTPNNEKSENDCDCDEESNSCATKIQEHIGNCKEFRIENNKTHLRIIGNCNKIRVNNNNGHLEVIGNTTRVKIVNNSGKVSYTGNCGKVYLGRESPVKQVDYIGNSGILKVVHEDDLSEYWKQKTSEKISIGNPSRKPTKDECCDNQRNSEKEKIPTRSSTEIRIDTNGDLSLHIRNNVSISNAASINLCNRSTIRIGSTAGNIVINNSYPC